MTKYENDILDRMREMEDLLRSQGLIAGAQHVAIDSGYIQAVFERLADNERTIQVLESNSMDIDETVMEYQDRQASDAAKIARASFALGELSGVLISTMKTLHDKGIIRDDTMNAAKESVAQIVNRARLND